MQTPVKSGAQKRTRTHRHRVITDTWTGDKKEHGPGKATHRLRNLGIASPFDLPKDPYFLLELFAIVLCRRIHFLSVKTSHYFQVISEPLNLTLRATRITGQFEQITNLARGIPTGIATVTPLPPYHKSKGRPRTCTSSIFGTFQGQPPRPKRFNQQDRWAGQQLNPQHYQETPVESSQESPVLSN